MNYLTLLISELLFALVMQGWGGYSSYASGYKFNRDMKIKFDWVSALLVIVLIAVLIAFFTGVFPYPYGWIVITILLVLRLTANQAQER